MKKHLYVWLIAIALGFAWNGCRRDGSNHTEPEEQVQELIDQDAERADSLKRALGIQ